MTKLVDLKADLATAKELHPIVAIMFGTVMSVFSSVEHLTHTMPTASAIQVRIFAAKSLTDLAQSLMNDIKDLPEFRELYPDYDA